MSSPDWPLDLDPTASPTGSDLLPLLIVPLLEVDLTRGKRLDGMAVFVQQLDVDLVFAATVPARRVPEGKKASARHCSHYAQFHASLPVGDSDVWLEVVQEGWAVAFVH